MLGSGPFLTIAVAGVIAIAFAAVIIKSVIDKKKGKRACSCGGNCSVCGLCPSKNDK